MSESTSAELLKAHRAFFNSGTTRDISFRLEQLTRLRQAIVSNEREIFEALRRDLRKPAFEAYGGESAIVVSEIDFAIKHLACWAKPKKVRTPLAMLPSRSAIHAQPYGVALIIGPWNFPFQLMFAPLVAAIAAGNCALLKPSHDAPHSSHLIAKIVSDTFDPAYISVSEGGLEVAQELLQEPLDYIFFTGGPAGGREVMAAAAKHLTPVALELGGKNPCIVDDDIHLEHTARRIVWGKFFNAGQSCVAVDYILANRNIKEELTRRIMTITREFYGSDPKHSPDFGRIVNERHFDRLQGLMHCGRIRMGGSSDRAERYIEPTILDEIVGDEPVMQEEIFGPLLPILEYRHLGEAIEFVNAQPKPLALYFFSHDTVRQERVLRETSSGGGCINDTVIQETSVHLPFGGVGMSGIGAYHGKAGFDAFSHHRSIVRSSFLVDIPLRYPPYKDHLKWLRKIF